MSVPYECYFCLNLQPFFTDDRSFYLTHETIFLWNLEPFKPPFFIFLLSFVKPFEPPDAKLFCCY